MICFMNQEIIDLYKTNSLTKISTITGFSRYKIKKILKDGGVPLRATTENLLLSRGIKNLEMFSKENISMMYKNMSVHDMAVTLGIHYRNVYPWLRKYNIPTKSSLNNEQTYYVYVLCDPSRIGLWIINGYHFYAKPFYIGYGKSDRCHVHMTNNSLNKCNKSKNDIIKNILLCGKYPIIHKVATDLCMDDAINLESDMIRNAIRNEYDISNKSAGGEIGGRYMITVAKYEPDFTNFNHKYMCTYNSVAEATIKNKISKINFKGISGGFIYRKFDYTENIPEYFYMKLSRHAINVYGETIHHNNPVCVYDINGKFIKISKPNIYINNLFFRMPDNLYLYKHPKGYYCVKKKNVKWNHRENILNHTIMKNGKLTLQFL